MAAKSGFNLKTPPDMFRPTDPTQKHKGDPMFNLPLDKLIPFKSHPFKAYEGHQLEDMVESIKANGVIVPIIVRPTDESAYEILSGHNRVSCAKIAEIETIPTIVRDGLSDEEALLIVTETNLLQRSFADMSHSERAVTLSMHYESIKLQGKRIGLIQEIENMVNDSNTSVCEINSPMAKKSTNMDKVGQEYALSKDSVARYLRIIKLIGMLKGWLDESKFGIRPAVMLSYLSENEQHIVCDVLASTHYKLDTNRAEMLRKTSKKKPLDYREVEQILTGTNEPKTTRTTAFKLKSKIVSQYFKPEQKAEEIEATIVEALEFFYANRLQKGE